MGKVRRKKLQPKEEKGKAKRFPVHDRFWRKRKARKTIDHWGPTNFITATKKGSAREGARRIHARSSREER